MWDVLTVGLKYDPFICLLTSCHWVLLLPLLIHCPQCNTQKSHAKINLQFQISFHFNCCDQQLLYLHYKDVIFTRNVWSLKSKGSFRSVLNFWPISMSCKITQKNWLIFVSHFQSTHIVIECRWFDFLCGIFKSGQVGCNLLCVVTCQNIASKSLKRWSFFVKMFSPFFSVHSSFSQNQTLWSIWGVEKWRGIKKSSIYQAMGH